MTSELPLSFELPPDLDAPQVVAIVVIFVCWFGYSAILKAIGRGSLNEQLSTVRVQWLRNATVRAQKPFDGILLGHIVNSISFFGSATMIVLAGVITVLASVRSVYYTMSELHLTAPVSFDLFVVHVGILNVILAMCFFSFTYALRKLIYVIALVGGLPEGKNCPDGMTISAATVLSEALKTFNFGIRGYYYFVAALGLLISPYVCLALTVLVTVVLFYRQLATNTARAIRDYVEASKQVD